ncbi:MAG: hypothetical protein O0X96_05640 [Methanocorpusculum sp.]|nr:hypothetical protein [Methanocorpusculum sp.]MDE2524593.1 hypothetical protein [Methanocorpusculum sp.]
MNLTYEITFVLAANNNQPQTPAQIAEEIIRNTRLPAAQLEAVQNIVETTLDTLCLFGLYTSPDTGRYILEDIWYATVAPCIDCRIREEHDAIMQQLRGVNR